MASKRKTSPKKRKEGPDMSDKSWKLGGNAGTNPKKDFIGTTDDKDLVVNVGSGNLVFRNDKDLVFQVNGANLTINIAGQERFSLTDQWELQVSGDLTLQPIEWIAVRLASLNGHLI